MSHRVALALSAIFPVGGIQRFNRMLCLALDQLAPELGLEITVLSQDDSEEDYRRQPTRWRNLRFVAGGGPRGLSVKTVALCARRRQELLLLGLLGMTPVGLVCLPLVRRGFGFVAHGTESWDEPRRSRRFAARRARFVLAVSRYTAQAIQRSCGVQASVVRLLPNTLEPNFERLPEAPRDTAEPRPELLTVGRLLAEEGKKGVDFALRAFARITERHPQARYRIIGRGSDKPRLVKLAERLQLGDRVSFEQDLTDEELAEAYRRCSVFVLPSGQEGFGIVFLEAMRFSKPCIGGNTGGTPEVIEDGRTGYLVEFGDVDSLERRIDTLLGDRALRRRMGEAGRVRLLEQFVFERFRSRVRDHLRALLES